ITRHITARRLRCTCGRRASRPRSMSSRSVRALMRRVLGVAIGVVVSTAMLAGETPDPSTTLGAGAHVAQAKAAAGNDYQNLFNFLCAVPGPAERTGPAARGGAPQGRGRATGPPERSTWYVEPVKVFDNLYFVGQSEYSAWAV